MIAKESDVLIQFGFIVCYDEGRSGNKPNHVHIQTVCLSGLAWLECVVY